MAAAPARPNILLVLVDDMGYSDPAPFGGEIETPNLERLARAGVIMPGFYNMARCYPTRASLMTGRYPHEVGMGGGMQYTLASGERFPKEGPGPLQGYLSLAAPTIAEVLREHGYRNYAVGKWHLGEDAEYWPTRRGFDRYFGPVTGTDSYFQTAIDRSRVRKYLDDETVWTPPGDGFYATSAFSEKAVEYLDRHLADFPNTPFFLYLAYNAPHWPLHALDSDIERFRGRYDAGWDELRKQRHERAVSTGLVPSNAILSPRPADVPAWSELSPGQRDDWARRMEVYAAMIYRMDAGIGTIIEALDRAGALEDTLILFASDNGASDENLMDRPLYASLVDEQAPIGAAGSIANIREPWANLANTPYRDYKGSMLEGGIKAPLLVSWPNGALPQNRVVAGIGSVIDVLPTILRAAGARYPVEFGGHGLPALPGVDLFPLLRSEPLPGKPGRRLYWSHLGYHAMRDGDWKIVKAPGAGDWSLFFLDDDPTELRELSSSRPDVLRRMIGAWDEWARHVGVESLD